MKRIINYILACVIMVFASSCVNDEKDIFPASPAERLNQALKDNFTALTSAPNGWAMEYFATSASAGYTLLAKFETSGKVTMAAKNELTENLQYQTDTSLFEMIGDNGPVLTFNTFNKVLHRFSNPENPDGYGLEGDYEFVVISRSDEQIVLKGKKRGTVILLNKIPANISWENYVAALDSMNSLLFSPSAPRLTMRIGTSTYALTNGFSRVFTIKKEGAGQNLPFDAPFIVTRTGIRFHDELQLDGVAFQSFTLNDDRSALVSTSNPDLKIVGAEDLALYFVSNVKVWELVTSRMSPSVKSAYDQVVQSAATAYNATDVKIAIRYYTTRKTYVLTLNFVSGGTDNEGNLDLNLATSGSNSINNSYKNSGDAAGLGYYNELAGLKELTALISGSFALTTESMLNPRYIRFGHKTNTAVWFSVIAQ